MTPREIEPAVFNVRDLAAYFQCHVCTIYRLLRQKQLPGFRIGIGPGDWRFNREEIDKWMAAQPRANEPR